MTDEKLDNPLETPRTMTKEEEEEWEVMVRQRRSRGGGFYGGMPPHPSTLESDFVTRSSGLSEPHSTKTFEKISSHSNRFCIGYADTIGRRPTMEDEIRIMGQVRGEDEDFVAIFDGHGGREVAQYAATNLHGIVAKKLKELTNVEASLKSAFLELNDGVKGQNLTGGTTALVALLSKTKVYIANAGDSRAVLLRDNTTVRVTTDHKPDIPEEQSRIEKSGGMVTKITNKQGKTISRVNGMLAVSRALGDIFLQPFVTAEPEVFQFDLANNNKVLILACDGVWDVLSDEETTEIANNEPNPELAAVKIRDAALAKGSADNISVIVVRFPPVVGPASNQEATPSSPPFVGGCKGPDPLPL